MKPETKKYLIYGGVMAVVVIGVLLLTASGAEAASTDSMASNQFDTYISKAKVYANQQSGFTKLGVTAAINLAVANKSKIIAKSKATGNSVLDQLKPFLSAFPDLQSQLSIS